MFQPNVITRDGTLGVQVGNLGVVTSEGFESLHAYPTQLILIGGVAQR